MVNKRNVIRTYRTNAVEDYIFNVCFIFFYAYATNDCSENIEKSEHWITRTVSIIRIYNTILKNRKGCFGILLFKLVCTVRK